MTTEEIKLVIQSLQDQIKYGQEQNIEVSEKKKERKSVDIDKSSFEMIWIIKIDNKKRFLTTMITWDR